MSTVADIEQDLVGLCKELISRRSVTPEDAGCQDLIAQRLQQQGFAVEAMPFGNVKNLWARRGKQAPLFVFAGHTDVVPPGEEADWRHPPFAARIEDGVLYGRGAADMKTAIAAMLTAVERFTAKRPDHRGSIGFLITSDEEGAALDGTVKVVQELQKRGEQMDYCLVGESTAVATVGDTMKNGRRGSLTGAVTVKGIQGHVAYPDRADNPIHRFSHALSELCKMQWDGGNEFFPPTSMQFSNIHSGTGADNVIPAQLQAVFNFRFSSEVTSDQLKARTEELLRKHGLDFELSWRVSGNPFLTQPGTLTQTVSDAVRHVCGLTPELSTSGGTSDARFIAPTGAQVIELGLVNESIHKTNENARVDEIVKLSRVYEEILCRLLA